MLRFGLKLLSPKRNLFPPLAQSASASTNVRPIRSVFTSYDFLNWGLNNSPTMLNLRLSQPCNKASSTLFHLDARSQARTIKSEAHGAYLVKVPKMGDSITEGSISAWKKSIGDYVKVDDVICVIDTDKVSVDIHTDVSGRIIKYAAEEGETVYVGGDLVSIDTSSQQQQIDETSQSANINSTPAYEPVPNKTRYKPMIAFPDRTHKPHSKTSGKVSSSQIPADQKQFSRPTGTLDSIAAQDSPPVNTSINISDDEIEIINMGGISSKTENKFGTWKNYTDMV